MDLFEDTVGREHCTIGLKLDRGRIDLQVDFTNVISKCPNNMFNMLVVANGGNTSRYAVVFHKDAGRPIDIGVSNIESTRWQGLTENNINKMRYDAKKSTQTFAPWFTHNVVSNK